MYSMLYGLHRGEQVGRYMGGIYAGPPVEIDGYRVRSYETEKDLEMSIYNSDNHCVVFTLDKSDKVAVVSLVNYMRRHAPIVDSENTVALVQFALNKIREHGGKCVRVMDRLLIDQPENSKRILSLIYFIKYGMTWYEKHFGFQIDETHKKEHETSKELRNTISFQEPYDYSNEQEMEYIRRMELSTLFYAAWEKNLE